MPARTIQISHLGQTYTGLYETGNGVISVSSAYGSRSTPHTGKNPGLVAVDLLKKIVEDYRR